jgi:hypothetical protein
VSACLLMSTIGPMLMCQTLFLKEIGCNVRSNGIISSTFLLTLNVARQPGAMLDLKKASKHESNLKEPCCNGMSWEL